VLSSLKMLLAGGTVRLHCSSKLVLAAAASCANDGAARVASTFGFVFVFGNGRALAEIGELIMLTHVVLQLLSLLSASTRAPTAS
jgi:hypothetical protein